MRGGTRSLQHMTALRTLSIDNRGLSVPSAPIALPSTITCLSLSSVEDAEGGGMTSDAIQARQRLVPCNAGDIARTLFTGESMVLPAPGLPAPAGLACPGLRRACLPRACLPHIAAIHSPAQLSFAP